MNPARITTAYSLLTLTDGALRMLVLFHAASLGADARDLAGMFALYELAGVFTNVFGGRLADRIGTLPTMRIGLLLQGLVLCSFALPATLPPVWLLMLLQGFAGIAKDLTKIGAKSVATVSSTSAGLFRGIAQMTGTKNAVKGLGFFVGGLLLVTVGSRVAYLALALCVGIGFFSVRMLPTATEPKRTARRQRALLSSVPAVNLLAVARLFLFGARDIWFALAIPLWFAAQPGWGFWQSGAVFAAYTIAYGFIQAYTPRILAGWPAPTGRVTALVTTIPALVCFGAWGSMFVAHSPWWMVLWIGIFSAVFAVASALHSFLIGAYAAEASVSADIGLYYSANALGRLLGLVLSGFCYATWGMPGALLGAALCMLPAIVTALPLPAPLSAVTVSGDE